MALTFILRWIIYLRLIALRLLNPHNIVFSEARTVKPEWAERLQPGRWFQISGDNPDLDLPATRPGTRYLVDNDPARDPKLNPARGFEDRLRIWLGKRPVTPWQGRSGFSSITEAWNGAVLATRVGESGSMVVFGGGHNDYFGSDMHGFDLNSREWSRISDGYISQEVHRYGAGAVYPQAEYPDGSPLPPHTYNYVQYDPIGNDYLLFKGQLELGPDVQAVSIAHMYNFDTLSWRRSPRQTQANLNSGGWTTWDSKRGVLWGHSGDAGGGNGFLYFDPRGENTDGTFGRWSELFPSKLPGEADHNAMAIHPERDIVLVTAHARNALCAIDPAKPDRAIKQLRSGGKVPKISEYSTIEYAPNLRAFIYYSATDPGSPRKISTPPGHSWTDLSEGVWTWRDLLDMQHDFNPIAHASKLSTYPTNVDHTFGRFRIASYADLDVAILVRHVDSPVYAMRLS